MNDWITGIVALLGGIGGLGGLCSIFLFYRENKRAKQLDNEHKANEEWQGLVTQYKGRVQDLEETVKTKDSKIDNLYKDNNELRKRNDKLSSKCAVLRITHCKVVGCANRIPPMGSRENACADEEQTITDKQE